MKNNYLVVNTSKDPFYNLALEEFLLTRYTEGNVVMLWQNDNTIVIGRHQNALEEINRQYVEENNIKVVRRNTGGGAVYHDLGNLNYTIIADRTDTNENMMRLFSQSIIDALEELGVKASFSGRNDVMVGEKKISGTAQKIYKDRVLHHGCILFASDLQNVSRCLNVKNDKFTSKSVKYVRSRVGNVTEFLKQPLTILEFKQLLEQKLLRGMPHNILNLSVEEEKEVEKLSREKYASWEWTYASPIKCNVHNYQRYEGGTVEVYVNMKDGIIEECQMYGDFMAQRPAMEIGEALKGCRYHLEDILSVLDDFAMEEYFGAIGAMEVALCICCAKE